MLAPVRLPRRAGESANVAAAFGDQPHARHGGCAWGGLRVLPHHIRRKFAHNGTVTDRQPEEPASASTPEHLPVLSAAVVEHLAPVIQSAWVDCTTGLGGHAAALLAATPANAQMVGLDVDPANLATAAGRIAPFQTRVRLVQRNFAELGEVLDELGLPAVDAILADLGVSSNQISRPEMGLSFDRDGPLDMRLDAGLEATAADLVNTLPERELADLIYIQSQEPHSRRIAKRICAARRRARITRTVELARIVAGAFGSRRGRIHPATRTFMALRIAVNGESAALKALLATALARLRPGGRLGVISFHSGEDRVVKLAMRQWAADGAFRRVTRRPIVANDDEIRQNPRSRSARLRVAERC